MKAPKRLISIAVSVGITTLLSLHGSCFAAPAGSADTTSNAASATEIIRAAHVAEPLVATAPTTFTEDFALAKALKAYEQRTNPDDFGSLTAFLSDYPNSPWSPAVLTNLGLAYLHNGYFSRALDAFRNAWREGKGATEPHARALVDRAVGELARLDSSLGHLEDLAILFGEIGDRPVSGPATETIQTSSEMLSLAEKDPRHLFLCGPQALASLLLAQGATSEKVNFLLRYRAGANGTNLAEVGRLADKANFPHRFVFREPGQRIPVPSIVHWKVGHFAAIVGEANGRYEVKDPAFPSEAVWVTPAALDAEASGYFLTSTEMPPEAGWREVHETEAATVWGKGPTTGTQAGGAGTQQDTQADGNGCGGGKNGGMCGYNIGESSVSVTLTDRPVGYSPPIGPSAKVTITYNQREDSQPANFNFFNVSPKWTLNFLSYVTDDPSNPGANVTRYLPGGGAYYYSGYQSSSGAFAAQNNDGSILVLTSQTPITYQRQLQDGSIEAYAQTDGSTGYPRKIFLSQIADPQGNVATLNYDSQLRLTSITDAVGRQTTFSYGLTLQPMLVTRITDPFGRSAALAYDSSGRLSSITDVLGLTSNFSYDSNSLVNALTTPYGTTSFAYTAPGTSSPPRFVQVTDPLGYHEREEWVEPAPIPDSDPSATVPQGMPVSLTNAFLTYRDSFHWDKNAYVVAGCTPTGGCDYTKARDRHFAHVSMNSSLKSTTIESVKYPLENRIWFNYPGQTGSINSGSYNTPIATGRVLDDGTTQLRQYSFDTTGYFNLTQSIDPIGRTTSFAYANHVDISAISQTTAYGIETTIAQFIYNTHHRPVFYTDAAGQTTTFTYNAAGQLTSVTNPLNQTTQYQYDTSHNLTTIINANGVTAATFIYDAFNRISTYTDSEGWTVTYNYDNADRTTKITYPDGTADIYTYDKLNLASHQDRQNRVWTYSHDSDRRLTAVTDPLGNQTLLAYNGIGKLISLTDPKNNVTTWNYDVQGRLTSKQYADSSTITYTYESTTSRLKSLLDALGQTKQFTYAKDDRLSGLAYLNAVNPTSNVAFTYDPFFTRLTSMTDGNGTTQYSYVPVGSFGALRLQQENSPQPSSTISYTYDALGRRSSQTVAAAGAETFQYDAIGRVVSHTSDLGSFSLNYLGQTSQITQRQLLPVSANLATSWSYLPNSGDRRLASIGNIGLSSSQFSNFQFTTTPEKFISGITETSDASSVYPNAGTQTASYNNLNQLTNLSGQTLTFDANGNLLADGQRNYTWDAENRILGITYPAQPGKRTTFTYDGLGRRTAIASTPAGGGSTVTTSYIWCGAQLCQARNASNTPTREYFREGELVPGSPAQSYYYGRDQIGSVRRVFASATTAPAYSYDPYGNALQATAPLTDFNYAGMFYNADSGLYLTQYRAYDPIGGHWLSRDPNGEDGVRFSDQQAGRSPLLVNGSILGARLGYDSPGWQSASDEQDDINLYSYGTNNPISNSDPTGRSAAAIPAFGGGTIVCGPICGGVAAAVAIVATGVIIYEARGTRPPSDAKSINETEWSGDHKDIKEGVQAGPTDDVRIEPDGGIWVKQPDGSWTGPDENGYADQYTGSGNPSGRTGRDRERRRGGNDDCD
jgi:RHS repeat-associated protein